MTYHPEIAVLVEGAGGAARDGLRAQFLILPTDTGSVTYSRLTNGGKGKANAWSAPVPADLYGCEALRFEPVGVVLTDGDRRNIAATGWSPVLASKAITALSKVEGQPAPSGALLDALMLYSERVASRDPGLDALVRDGRRSVRGPVVSTPVAAPVVAPVVAPVAAPVAAEPVVVAPVVKLATVPDHKLAERYINRTLSGTVSDFAMLDYARANQQNVLLLGPTGSGKTALPLAYAAARGLKCYSVAGNQAMEPSHLFGRFVPDGKGGFVWVDGPAPELAREGGVLIIDEINAVSAKILTVLYPLLDSRRELTLLDHMGETIKAHPDLLIVATGNPRYVGTGPLSEAMLDRYPHRWTWDYDAEVEKKLVTSKSLLAMVTSLRTNSEIETPVSTRLMVEFESMVTGLGWDYAKDNLLNRFLDNEDERAVVKVVLDTYHDNIGRELGTIAPPEPVVEEQPVPDEYLQAMASELKAPWETPSTGYQFPITYSPLKP